MIDSFVYIIESPGAKELLDGITEGRALSEALTLANIPHYYSLVTSLETLEIALGERLVSALDELSGVPILHFSMHGNQDGIGLTDESFLSWHDLRNLLLSLGSELQANLLLCMSCCYGTFGSLMAMYPGSEPPFAALVGNSEASSWSDAAVGYITFYHLLFKGEPLEAAVEVMKLASGDSNFEVISGNAAKQGWLNYLRQQKQQMQQRREELRRHALSLAQQRQQRRT